jgi:2,3-bisphosphoglycerate-dependent phosphoglycerate mutase
LSEDKDSKFYFCVKYKQMDITKVTMIRHGETEWNVAMRLQGKQNSELTLLGIKQVELVAEELGKRTFDVLISSDQRRAVNTAEIINKYHNLKIILNEDLRERNFGIMEGLTREEIAKKFPEVHDAYIERKSEFQVPDGESLIQLFSRVTNELKKIINLYEGKSILIVTHGGVLDCTMRMVFSLSLDRSRNFSIYNAAINTFTVTNGQWDLIEWGNIDHLASIATFAEFNQKINRIYF